MNKTLEIIKTRRTIRRYKKEQISKEELDAIIEAGLFAPSAGGRQMPILMVCQDQVLNGQLGKICKEAFGLPKTENKHEVNEKQMSIAEDGTIKSAFYDAPTVITIFSKKDYRYSIHDSMAVAQNMMIQAWSMEIGSAFIGRSEEVFASELGIRVKKEASVPDDYEARGFILLGYCEGETGNAKPRKNRVLIVK